MIRTFTVSGKPVGKGRPRFTRNGHVYTPKKTSDAEKEIRNAYIEKYGKETIKKDTPVEIYIVADFGIPKSDSKTKANKKIAGLIKPTIKPDIDNICKLVLDSLNGIAYDDDKQVYKVTVSKRFSAQEGIHIWIIDKEDN